MATETNDVLFKVCENSSCIGGLLAVPMLRGDKPEDHPQCADCDGEGRIPKTQADLAQEMAAMEQDGARWSAGVP